MQKSLSDLNRVQVQRELNIHSRLRHANVLDLYAAFEDAEAIYLVMQCVSGSLVFRRPHAAFARFAPRGDLFHELKRCGGFFSDRCAAARQRCVGWLMHVQARAA